MYTDTQVSNLNMSDIIEDLNSNTFDSSLVVSENIKPSLFEKMFEGYNILVFNINDELYFKGKDIATVLQYSDTAKAITNNCNNQISVGDLRIKVESESTFNKIKDLGPLADLHPQTVLITEDDLYALIIRSNKRGEAEKFRKWVYKVIKEIRKTGSYNLNGNLLIGIVGQLTKIIESQNAKIDELNNKVDLLIQANQYNLPAKLFSLQDGVDYLNINFATGNNKATVQSLKDFLRDDDVKFLKSNYKPYVKYINMHYVTYNSNPFNPVDTNLKFTKTGLEYIISELRRFNYIK